MKSTSCLNVELTKIYTPSNSRRTQEQRLGFNPATLYCLTQQAYLPLLNLPGFSVLPTGALRATDCNGNAMLYNHVFEVVNDINLTTRSLSTF
jgi:hypothetical protein